jgi:hypothetical protein
MKSIYDSVTGRFARNVYLWLGLILLKLAYFAFDYSAVELNFWLLGMCLFMALLYTNNLLLLPKLFVRKRWIVYLLTILPFIGLYSFISAAILHFAVQRYPGISVFKIAWMPLPSEKLASSGILIRAGIIFNTFIVFLFSLSWYAADHKRRIGELQLAQKVQSDTELAFLKDQLNPHFLFNTLNNLYGLSLKKSESTPDLISKLSVILKYLLYDSNVALVPFGKEKDIMRAYIELELIRLNRVDNFDFVINSDNDESLIAPLLWLPLLENIFKYGIYFSSSEAISFHCYIAGNVMKVYSKNNYDATEMKKHKKESSGVGLSNLRKRLQILYPRKHSLNIIQTADHFIVDVEIKLQ